MKNVYFNSNDSLVTLASPNQTSETLPRDYRTGTINSLCRNLTLLFAILVMSVANVGMAWGQTTWVRLDSIDFTNTTNFPAQDISGTDKDATTKTISGVFFTAKKSKTINLNNTTPGVVFNDNGDLTHAVAIPVTGVNEELKIIVYHNYNNASANFKTAITHSTNNDPSESQTTDLAMGNSGTKNKNDYVQIKTELTGSSYIVWATRAGSGYTTIKSIAIYTKAPSCDAADLTASNITSNGDQEAGTGITFSKVGSPASGDTWYWQTSATGTDKTSNATSPYTTATTAGSYTVYLRAYNTAGNCWGTAASMTNTIYPAPSAMIHNTFAVNDAWSSTIATQDKTNITGLNAMAAVGESVGSGSNKSGLTQKIPSQSSEDAGKYMSLSFNVASGKQLNVTSVVFDEQPVTGTGTFKVSISDNQGSATRTQTIASDAAGTKHTLTLDGDIVGSFKGTVTVKVWAYGWGDGYRFGDYFYIHGTVTDAAACTAPSGVSIGSQWLTFVGESLTLTATPTGGSGGDYTYQWYKGGTAEGNKIAGATSATYYKASCTAADADDYYCEVKCGSCGTFSSRYRVQVLRLQLMWEDGTPVADYTYHNFTPLGGDKATVTIPLEAYNYSYMIIDGYKACGNSGTVQRSNYSGMPWVHNVSDTRTGLNCDVAGDYVFTLDYSNYASWTVRVDFPPEKYYYKGNEDGWSTTHEMIKSCDGNYAYYWAKGKNSLNELGKGNNNNFLIMNEAGNVTIANGNNLSSGFNSTDITNMGKWDGDKNACIYNENDFYIIVYYPNTAINSTSSPKICAATKLPGNATTAGEAIYFDNSDGWSSLYYRIGHRGYLSASSLTTVPGTARLYKYTTTAWEGYEAWNIANNQGNTGSHSVYDISTNVITKATNYYKCETDGNVTILLDGANNTEDGCTYYNVNTYPGLLTHNVAITAPSHGTLTVNYTTTANESTAFSSGNRDLAHTANYCVTAEEGVGYTVASITINGTPVANRSWHVLTEDVVVAATFTLADYTITHSAASNGTYTIKVGDAAAVSTNTTANYGQTVTLAASPSEGYELSSWTVTKAGGGTVDVVSNQFTMPNDNVTITATFALKTYTITYNTGTGDGITGSHANDTKTHGVNLTLPGVTFTRTGYTQTGWATSDGAAQTHALGGSYTTNAAQTFYPVWTVNQYSVTHTLSNVTKSSGATGANAATYGTNYTAVFAASSGYALPESITVSIGGSTKTQGTEYTWNQGTGTVTITGSYITGDIVITVTGVEESGASGDCIEWAGTPSSLTDGAMTVSTNLQLSVSGASIASDKVWDGSGNKTLFKIDGSDKYVQGHFVDDSEISTVTISAATNQTAAKKYAIVFCANSSFSSGVTVQTHTAPSASSTRNDANLIHEFTAPAGTKYFRIYRKYVLSETQYGDNETIRVYGVEVCPAACSNPVIDESATKASFAGGSWAQNSGHTITITATGASSYEWYRNTSANDAGATKLSETSNALDITADVATGTYFYKAVAKSGDCSSSTEWGWCGAMTITAAPTTYSVTYNANRQSEDDGGGAPEIEVAGGSVPAAENYTAGQTVTVADNTGNLTFTLDGAVATFRGWTTSPTGYSNPYYTAGQTFSMLTANVNLYAVWSFPIEYHTNGGTINDSPFDTYYIYTNNIDDSGVKTATLPTDVTKSGYTFGGWYHSEGLTGARVYDIEGYWYGTYHAYAKWNAINYTITYELYGGSLDGTQKTSYTSADDDYDLPIPTKDDNVFLGWYETYSAGEYSNPISVLASGSTGNKTYHAKWGAAATVNWIPTVKAGTSGFYKGGGEHTIVAIINQANWDDSPSNGNKDDLVLTASDGVMLHNITITINGDGKAQVSANFDIAGDIEGDVITFHLTIPSTETYPATESSTDVPLNACPGGYSVLFTSDHKNDAGEYFDEIASGTSQMLGNGIAKMIAIGDCKLYAGKNQDGYRSDRCNIVFKLTKSTDLDIYYCAGSSSRSFALYSFSSAKDLADIEPSDYSTKTKVTSVTGSKAAFAQTSATSSNPSISSGTVGTSGSGGGIKASYASLSAGYYILKNESSNEGYFYGFDIDGGDATGGIETTLSWSPTLADKGTVDKKDTDNDFTYSVATPLTSNTIGAIIYTSSDVTVATVNSAGTVHIVGGGSTTITATLAASGCYNSASISYTLNVASTCSDEPGTIVNNDGSVIEGNAISRGACETTTLKIIDYTEGATIQWYKDGATIGGATDAVYTIPAGESGVYSATVVKECAKAKATANSITVTTAGGVNPTIYADEFSVKHNREFYYRLMKLNPGETAVVATAPSGWTENTDFTITIGTDNIVYIRGKVSVASATTKTLTLTISNTCGSSTDKNITIHELVATAKPTIAWIATDEDNKGKVDKVKADQSTNTALYKHLETDYTLTPRNCYWTVNEKDLVKEYSKYDLIILTDYPNSQKGPNGDGRSKSYTNAIGLLIDHKPILTFEAFVSGCPNWGFSSNPQNTKVTQNTLTLLCNADDIFRTSDKFYAGADITTATVSSGQSLQGFAVNESPDFVYIAKITDDGKDYIACCERQVEPAERMMVFGLNANVMDNITADGKDMVAGFVNYLLIMDPAEIPDCSVIFKGGTAGHETDWYTETNWEGDNLPNQYASVRIDAPCEVGTNASPAKAGYVKIHTGSDGVHTYNGHLTINPQGVMIVQKSITRVEGNRYTVHMATNSNDLAIESSAAGNGTLIFDNKEGKSKAVVQMHCKALKSSATTWQYIGIPHSDVSNAMDNYYGSWLYSWNPTAGWEVVPRGGAVEPWTGYCITYPEEGHIFEMEGTLVATANVDIAVPAGSYQIIGNSWTAPIQIANFEDKDFGAISKTVYLFNTGTDSTATGALNSGRWAAGTYVSIPIHAAPYTGDAVINSMQGFYVSNSGSAGSIHLDYNKLVRPKSGQSAVQGQMHAPRRMAEASDEPVVLKLLVSGSRYDDRLVVLEREDFTTGHDDGWDGEKWDGSAISPTIWSENEEGGVEAVTATPDMEGTIIGFRAGEDEEYTFHFDYDDDAEAIYLLDMDVRMYVRILSGITYTFTCPDKGEHNRFLLTRKAPGISTGYEPIDGSGGIKATKFIKDNKMYILLNGTLYDATGRIVVR